MIIFSEDVPHLKEFKKTCRDHLQHQNPAKRPNLSEILKHNFFNHEFITIYKFLNFLPLKNEDEKWQFFSNILESLKCFDEETVAKQLSGLLLSRLTMLDQTARKDVIPYILKPKNGMLSNNNYNRYSIPKHVVYFIKIVYIFRKVTKWRKHWIFQFVCLQRTCETKVIAAIWSKR